MITSADSFNTYDLDKYFIIVGNSSNVLEKLNENEIKYQQVSENFSYNSGNNSYFLTVKK